MERDTKTYWGFSPTYAKNIQHHIAVTLKASSTEGASMGLAALDTTSCLAQWRGFSPAGHLYRAYSVTLSEFVPDLEEKGLHVKPEVWGADFTTERQDWNKKEKKMAMIA